MNPISYNGRSRMSDMNMSTARTGVINAPSSIMDAPALTLLAQNLVRSGPPFDSVRVANLKTQISSGTYTINSGMIAEAMISFYAGINK